MSVRSPLKLCKILCIEFNLCSGDIISIQQQHLIEQLTFSEPEVQSSKFSAPDYLHQLAKFCIGPGCGQIVAVCCQHGNPTPTHPPSLPPGPKCHVIFESTALCAMRVIQEHVFSIIYSCLPCSWFLVDL